MTTIIANYPNLAYTPTPTTIAITENSNGTRDILIKWRFAQSISTPASGFLIFYNAGADVLTLESPSIKVSISSTSYLAQGVSQSWDGSIGIAAYRTTQYGEIHSAIRQPVASPNWRVIGKVPDITATIGGADAATLVKNAADALTLAGLVDSSVTDILSDGVIDRAELQKINSYWDIIIAEQSSISAQATNFGAAALYATYVEKIKILGNFLNSGSLDSTTWVVGTVPKYIDPTYINTATSLSIRGTSVGADFRKAFKDQTTARTDIFQAVAEEAAKRSTWAGVSDTAGNKPADGATRNVARGLWVSGEAYLIGDTVTDAAGYGWVCDLAHTSSSLLTTPLYPVTENANWLLYVTKGVDAISVQVTSTNGSIFKVGQAKTTRLAAKVFQGGVEITSTLSNTQFKWLRASALPADDTTWNLAHTQGYPVIDVSVDDVNAKATFFCEITSL